MNIFLDAMFKTGSFHLVQVSCFQSVLWAVDFRQFALSVQKGFGGTLPG